MALAAVVPVRSFPTNWSTPVTGAAAAAGDCSTVLDEGEETDGNSWKSPFKEYEKRKTRQATLLIGRNTVSSLGGYDWKEIVLGMNRSGTVQGVTCKQHRSPSSTATWKTRALSGGDQVPKTPQDIMALHKTASKRKTSNKKSTLHDRAKPRLGCRCNGRDIDQGGVSNSEQIRQLALLVKRRLSLGGEASIDRPLSAVNFFEREKPTRQYVLARPQSPAAANKTPATSVSTASTRHASFSLSRNESMPTTETSLRSRLLLDDSPAAVCRKKRQRPATAQGDAQVQAPIGGARLGIGAAYLKDLPGSCRSNDVDVGPQKKSSQTGMSSGYDRPRRSRGTVPTVSGCQVTVQPKEIHKPRKFTQIPGVLPKEERILMEFDPKSLESLTGLPERKDDQVDGCAYVTSPNPEFFGHGVSRISVGGTGTGVSAGDTKDAPVSANRPPSSKIATGRSQGSGWSKRGSSENDLFEGSQKSRPSSRNSKNRRGGGGRLRSTEGESGPPLRTLWCMGYGGGGSDGRPRTAVARLEGIPPRPGSAAQAVFLDGKAWDKGCFPELMDGLEKAPLSGWETVGSSDLTPRN